MNTRKIAWLVTLLSLVGIFIIRFFISERNQSDSPRQEDYFTSGTVSIEKIVAVNCGMLIYDCTYQIIVRKNDGTLIYFLTDLKGQSMAEAFRSEYKTAQFRGTIGADKIVKVISVAPPEDEVGDCLLWKLKEK